MTEVHFPVGGSEELRSVCSANMTEEEEEEEEEEEDVLQLSSSQLLPHICNDSLID